METLVVSLVDLESALEQLTSQRFAVSLFFSHAGTFSALFCWSGVAAIATIARLPLSSREQRLLAARRLPDGWLVIVLVWSFAAVGNIITYYDSAAHSDSGEWSLLGAWLLCFGEVITLGIVVLWLSIVLLFMAKLGGYRGLSLRSVIVGAAVLVTAVLHCVWMLFVVSLPA